MKLLRQILFWCLFLSAVSRAEITPGDMVSWTNFSYVTCIAYGNTFAYFGTTNGILRYHRLEGRWYEPITVSDGLQGRLIKRIQLPPDESWITVETDQGIYTWQFGPNQWFLDSQFPTIYPQDSRVRIPLPVIFMPFGYQLLPSGFIRDSYFRDVQITAYLDDQFNTVFMGTCGIGPLKMGSRELRADFIPCGLLQQRTDVIYIEGDSLWVAGNEGDWAPSTADTRLGVTLFEQSRQQFTFYEPRYIPGFKSEIIYDIAGDRKNIYFAGRFGLTVHPRDDENNYFTLNKGDGLPGTETTALAVRNDSVWVGTESGLALYSPLVDSIKAVGSKLIGGLFITDLLLVGNKLIIGSDKGAFYIDLSTNVVGRLLDPSGSSYGTIRQLAQGNKEILIASEDGAVTIDLETEKATAVPYTNTAGGVYAIAADSTYIAAATIDGLMLINRESGKMRRFTERDGLLSIKINTLIPEEDYLWIGSEEGLTRFRWHNPSRVD